MVRLFTFCLALFLAMIPELFAQWSSNPAANNPLCLETRNQRLVRIISDGKGGTIFTWEDERPMTNAYDIYAQRMDANGNLLWALNGVPVCSVFGSQNKPQIVSDQRGGAWIVWKDVRNQDNDIFIQRIDSTGTPLYASGGIDLVPMGLKAREQSDPVICTDGKGGAYVAFMDNIQGGNFDNQIMLISIDSSGNIPWSSAGYVSPITRGSGMFQYMPMICSDGAGGCIVVWQWFIGGASGQYDLYAQRINASGYLRWGNKGIGLCTSAGSQGYPVTDEDGLRGVVTAWPDFRATAQVVYTQRLDSLGVKKWPEAKITTAGGKSDHPAIVGMGGGQAIVVWEDFRGGATCDIYAQRLDAAGAPMWAANGIPICTATNNQYIPYIARDGQGGVIIVWEDRRNGNINGDIYAQRLDANGNALWPADGLLISSAANTQTSPVVLNDGSGGGVFAWEDYRQSFNNANLYAFKVLADGSYPKSQPAMTLSTKNVDFGITAIGQKRDRPLNITNSGGDDLHITSITSSNPNFVPRPTSKVLASGTAFNDTIRFTPTVTGPDNGFIVITRDSWTSPDTIRVKGSGTGTPILEVVAKKVNFGYVKTGLLKDTNIVFNNTGLDTLKITVANSTNSAVTISPGIANVAPGKSVTQRIRFSPKVAGTINSRINLTSNALSSPDTMFITGTGFFDVAVQITPRVIAFGNLPVGTAMDTIIEIRNTSGDTLRVSSITSDDDAFVAVPSAFNTVPLGTASLRIRCKPTHLGPAMGKLAMTGNSTTSPDTITVSTIGIADVIFAPVSLNFGIVTIGTFRDTLVMIENKKPDTLHISGITSDNPAFTVHPGDAQHPSGLHLRRHAALHAGHHRNPERHDHLREQFGIDARQDHGDR
ncbi:MAG: choice-of-anchor D domain-containing protein [Ignavibacteria bacterium]|nr:choice-of-anchor D domain-containing protein [Ignavibacteria bacterium]